MVRTHARARARGTSFELERAAPHPV